jgi:hypothetical protein
MTNSPARLFQLCLVAALGLAHASSPARADITASKGKRDHSYAYLANGGSITMSGDVKDVARARSFRTSGPLLWFREAGQEYIVQDPDTLAQLDVIWKPGRELDVAESRLDRQHDGLDRKHDQLDSKRDALEARRDRLSDRDSELADRASEDSHSASARAEIAKKRRELQQQRTALDAEIRALEQPMNELRTQMDAIQRQLDVLRQKQEAISSKEETEMWALLRRAITAGTAKPVK